MPHASLINRKAWGILFTGDKMDSLWNTTAALPAFPRLEGQHKTDVLIIGGGLAGILCAWQLTAAGVDCVIAEGKRICGGVTGSTTAKITAQHGLLFDKLLHGLGEERSRMYLQANLEALEQYRTLCADIACDFEEADSFVYSRRIGELEGELRALERLGFRATFRQQLPIPVEAAGAVGFPQQAAFHPLKFAGALCRKLKIYEKSPVRHLENHIAITDHGRIEARKIIVATHFPFINTRGMFFLKMYQQRSYVLALRDAPSFDGMYIGAEENSLSFRRHGDLLLLGGGGHRTGKQGGGWAQLKNFAQQHYPGSSAAYLWATQDCMTLDGIPYIGQYSPRTPDPYVITGFNKWGMTNAMAGATVLKDMILGKDSPFAPVFAPDRSMAKPQLLLNIASSSGNLLRLSRPRCPHLGCALRWNPQERSWDCPCHGSRFDAHGHLLDNPATGDMKKPL